MSILSKLDTTGIVAAFDEAAHQGAAFLLGAAQMAKTTVAEVTKDYPLVEEAEQAALAWATAKGVPIGNFATLGGDILSLAQAVETATTPPTEDAEKEKEPPAIVEQHAGGVQEAGQDPTTDKTTAG